MSKRSTKIVSLVITLLVLLTMALPTYAQSSDYSSHWASAQIGKWLSAGVFTGNPDGTFKPDNAISRAEFAAVISRVFGYTDKADTKYSDVAATAWYADVVSKVTAAGVMQGNNGKFMPNDSITRQEAVVVFYRAFDLKVNNANAVSKFVDASDIASWSKDAFNAAVENSYISGQPGNKAAPKANITRAECAKLIDNIAGELKSIAGTYSGNIAKNLVVNAKDVVLKDMVISGDLFLAQGIGDGNVTLDNVVVKGRTVVRGGGENSIILKNTTLEGTLVVIKKDGKVRIVAQGSTEVANVELNSGAKLEEDGVTGEGFGKVEVIKIEAGQTLTLDGDFAEVTIEVPGVNVNIASGTVGKLTVAQTAANANIQIAAGATVTNLTANAAVAIKGEGKIADAVFNAPGSTSTIEPSKITLGQGVPSVKINDKEITENTGSTGGGGGGGGGGGDTVTVSNIKIVLSSDDKVSTNLSGRDDTDRVKAISFTTNALASTLKLTGIESDGLGSISINRTLSFTGANIEIGVSELLAGYDVGHEDMSLGTMKSIFGDYVKVIGTLEGTGSYAGYTKYNVSVRLELDGTALLNIEDVVDTVDKDGADITVTFSTDASGLTIEDINNDMYALMILAAGELPSVVSFDDGETWLSIADADDKAAIKAGLVAISGAGSWSELTIDDLRGAAFYFKKTTDNQTVYTLSFQ